MEAETLLTLAKEVNAKGFEDRIKRLADATNVNVAATRKLSREKGKLTKRETDLEQGETRLAGDVKAFEKKKADGFADLDERRAKVILAESNAKEIDDGATRALQDAEQKLAEARKLVKQARDKEASLAPKLELVEQLKA